jgi:molybdopterin-containing oxidoreductase family membrane subunit
LVWDFFAVATYGTVSLVFWYLGLIPDLATLRDRTVSLWKRRIYGCFALGWRGAAAHWHHYETTCRLLAGLATPLVISVHSIVGLDFAVSLVPGWHSTIFPPYFVAGAIFSGFAMVLTITIPLRSVFRLQNLVTAGHLDRLAKVMLITGLMVGYGYFSEFFMAWFSGNEFDWFIIGERLTGETALAYGTMLFCNVAVVQLLWFRAIRARPVMLFVVSILVNVGMWLERYVIVVSSLQRDFLPSSWGDFNATFWDWATFIGTLGLFLALILVFLRLLPALSMSELRATVPPDGLKGGGR